jgi:ABC-2 type transport system permease protein
MTLLFGAMLAALATVYDKESGVMRMLVIAPLRPYWIVIAKVLGSATAALLQALMLLVLLALLGYLSGKISFGYLALGLLCTALASAALGILIAAWTRKLENYAVMMNLVIFPVFFLSGSLYPVQHLPDWLRVVAMVNPHTYGVDLLKHALAEGAADFSVLTDMTAALSFMVAAVAIACFRFSRENAFEEWVHALGVRRAR